MITKSEKKIVSLVAMSFAIGLVLSREGEVLASTLINSVCLFFWALIGYGLLSE